MKVRQGHFSTSFSRVGIEGYLSGFGRSFGNTLCHIMEKRMRVAVVTIAVAAIGMLCGHAAQARSHRASIGRHFTVPHFVKAHTTHDHYVRTYTRKDGTVVRGHEVRGRYIPGHMTRGRRIK